MEYKSSPELIDLINQLKTKLTGNLIYLSLLFIVGSLLVYSIGKTLDLLFYVSELIMLVCLTLLLYSRVISKGNIINNTALNIVLLDNEIVIITAPFDFLFLANKKAKEIRLQIDSANVRKTSYPIKEIYDLNNESFKIINKEKELYIIVDFFDSELKEKLNVLKIS